MSAARKGIPQTDEHRAKNSAANRGRPKSPEHIAKIAAAHRGMRRSAQARANISAAMLVKAARGPASNLWRGGTPVDSHDDARYMPWKRAVHKRDMNTCQLCGRAELSGAECQADHIVAWADAPALRFDPANGRTLCRDCHRVRTAEQLRNRVTRRVT